MVALVTGASRGFGRATAIALAEAGHDVVAVARDRALLEELRAKVGPAVTPVVADVTDPTVAGQLLDTYQPTTLVLNAGGVPLTRPIHQQTWQTFSHNWEVDVQHVFHWTREALLRPLAPGSTVVTMSSGAAVKGSPMSGGYAGAKAAIRFVSSYAGEESARAGLGIRFVALLPQLTPGTDVGSAGVAAYAKRQGVDVPTFIANMGPVLTPDQVGLTIADLVADAGKDQAAYLLTAEKLAAL
ncbi:SDR family oxidoreductase [Fodinicola feengrottensis]|uniref:SDR family oxidoreductase n=1 Tax=Fodinicola feengrottensis TaxID=435914 RepID=A0ABN2IAJ8_9ACTN|nr:SDR family oxidoreductase [Fodinicola feengrottensis]